MIRVRIQYANPITMRALLRGLALSLVAHSVEESQMEGHSLLLPGKDRVSPSPSSCLGQIQPAVCAPPPPPLACLFTSGSIWSVKADSLVVSRKRTGRGWSSACCWAREVGQTECPHCPHPPAPLTNADSICFGEPSNGEHRLLHQWSWSSHV